MNLHFAVVAREKMVMSLCRWSEDALNVCRGSDLTSGPRDGGPQEQCPDQMDPEGHFGSWKNQNHGKLFSSREGRRGGDVTSPVTSCLGKRRR